jgi:hypothetical protein
MLVPLWFYEWAFGLRYGLLPNCQAQRPSAGRDGDAPRSRL